MKLKMSEALSLHFELNGIEEIGEDGKKRVIMTGLLRERMSMKLKLYLIRLQRVILEEYKVYQEAKALGMNEAEEEEMMNIERDIDFDQLCNYELSAKLLEEIVSNEIYPIFLKLCDDEINGSNE